MWFCHCIECQKQSGSAFGTSAIFPLFELPANAPISRWDRTTDSGRLMKGYFCSKCGTRIIHDSGTGRVSVKGGTLKGLNWGDAIHIWTSRAVVPIPEGAEQYEKSPPPSPNEGK